MAIETVRQAESSERIELPVLRLTNVSVRLGDKLALSGIDLEIESGAFVGLIGPNGSGKSTLLRAALGVLPLASGSVSVQGGRPEQARDSFAYLPQRGQLDLNLPLHARDVVMMGRIRHTGWLHAPGSHDREVVQHCLELVGLEDCASSPIF